MIKVENIEVMNINSAIRGARNPLESWNKSDSFYDIKGKYIIGEKDHELAMKLIKAGSDHSKFLRQIFVSMDITAPMSWWWDFDTYKIATTKNSTSRMHKLGTRLLDYSDFSWDDEETGKMNVTPLRQHVLNDLNNRIAVYQKLKDSSYIADKKEVKNIWRGIIMDLPDSYNFLATWTGSYENLRNVYHARKNHKQREFRDFCKIIALLPYSEFITTQR